MGMFKLGRYRKSSVLSFLFSLSVFIASGSLPVMAAESSADVTDTEAIQAEAGSQSSENELSPEDLYHENEWNFVEDSMDISGGIPDNVIGRLARIREKGKLVVCTEPYFAPQEFIDPDLSGQERYAGADMELARLIAKRMDVELEIVPLTFTEVLSSIGSGKYDLAISALSYTPGRASSMELSKGYHFTSEGASVGLIIRKDDADRIKELADLSGKNIAAQSGSLQELLAAENITDYRQFVRLPSIQDVYNQVTEKSADAAAVDLESARLYIQSNPDCGLTLMEGISFSLEEQFEGDRIAGPKDDLELMYFVNGVIDEVLASGQYETWFAEASERAADLGL